MRVIAVGCEYSGVSTLIDQVHQWGLSRGISHHLDDHFTIPDAYHLSDEEQLAMLAMLPAIKERFQRFQIVYHVRLLHRYRDILLGGFHIEEKVYGPKYYYPGHRHRHPRIRAGHARRHPTRPPVRRARNNPRPHGRSPAPTLIGSRRRRSRNTRSLRARGAGLLDPPQIRHRHHRPNAAQLLETFLNRSIPHLNPEGRSHAAFGWLVAEFLSRPTLIARPPTPGDVQIFPKSLVIWSQAHRAGKRPLLQPPKVPTHQVQVAEAIVRVGVGRIRGERLGKKLLGRVELFPAQIDVAQVHIGRGKGRVEFNSRDGSAPRPWRIGDAGRRARLGRSGGARPRPRSRA